MIIGPRIAIQRVMLHTAGVCVCRVPQMSTCVGVKQQLLGISELSPDQAASGGQSRLSFLQ